MTSLGPSLPMKVVLFCTNPGSALKSTMAQSAVQQVSESTSSDTNPSRAKASEGKSRNASHGSPEGKETPQKSHWTNPEITN